MFENINNKSNSFRQANSTWLFKAIVNYKYIELLNDHFTDIADATACFEHIASKSFESKPDDLWIFEAYFEYNPGNDIIDHVTGNDNIEIKEFSFDKIIDKDWISEVQKSFNAFYIGKFIIHTSYHKEKIPINKYSLLIDAGRAFGTGEHETTNLCISAINHLSKKYKFSNMLDVGCGSGILAISMAKIWRSKTTATDIDKEAIIVAKSNAKKNKVTNFINFSISDGYNSNMIRNRSKFDLIIANILARPLVDLAIDLKQSLSHGGIAIISGFLDYQEKIVINAHKKQNLKIMKIFRKNNWSAIILSN